MKRHPSLETLSFEHHDALVIALRLRKGVASNASQQAMKEYALSVYRQHLIRHFEQEENSLVKALQSKEEIRPLVQRMLDEHQRFAELAEQLQFAGKGLRPVLTEFSELLNSHVRFEERELFSRAEEVLSREQLERISEYLHREHKPVNKNWPVIFWEG